MELAKSIKNHQHCPSNGLSDHLHEVLQDLDAAIKSQPRLFLGSNRNPFGTIPAAEKSGKTEPVSLLKLQSRKLEDQAKEPVDKRTLRPQESIDKRTLRSQEPVEKRTLRPQSSRVVITTLDFSEALPLAAFTSLLVEMVARLDPVIEEVEVLGRAANFRKFSETVDRKHDGMFQDHGVSQVAP